MTEGRRNFTIGLVTILATVGLIGLLFIFGELDRFVDDRYAITLRTDNAAGLREGSQVELNGVAIGTVADVSSTPETTTAVRIDMRINGDTRLPRHVRPYSETSFLGGAAVLQFVAGSGPHTDFLSMDGSAELIAEVRFRLFEEINSEIDARMAPIERALGEFEELSSTYTEFGRTLNDVVAPLREEDTNLPAVFDRVITLIDELEQTSASARAWLDEDTWRTELTETIRTANQEISRTSDNANEMLDRAAIAVEDFNTLTNDLRTDADALTAKLLPAADELGTTLERFRQLLVKIDEGEGTVAQLINNPDLYRSLDDAATRLERVLVEVQLYVQKIKAEGLKVDL